MLFKVVFFAFAFFAHCVHSDEPIIVNLETESKLFPIAVAPLSGDNFSKEYLARLDQVLQFDLNFNGMTYVVNANGDDTAFSQPSHWKNQGIYFAVQATIKNKTLSAKLLMALQGKIKQIDGISLTGILSEDRKQLHLLSDLIFKSLFNFEGVSQTQILYTVKVKSQGGKSSSEVVKSDYDGGNMEIVTDQRALCVSPCYFPAKNGYHSNGFAFVSYKTGQPKIYFSSLEENKLVRFSLLKGNQFMPAFSPSCDKIAFICDVTGNPDLFIQNLNEDKQPIGKPQQLFSASYGTQATPTFSPDGSKIAFVSNKDGSPRIYVTSIPTSEKKAHATLLTKKNRENTAPNWSPDGKKIAYTSLTKGVRQIWIYNFETGQETQLTDGTAHKENPVFAPDSLHLAFNSAEDSQSEIFIMHLNHGKAVKITSGKGDKRFPSWEPRK